MGEVVIQQPEPFDLYVDPKSRDMLFSDAAYIMVRKILPKNHLMKIFPEHKRKIANSNSDEQSYHNYTTRSIGDDDQKLFSYNDAQDEDWAIKPTGELDELVEFFEVYEKIKVS